MIDSIFVNFGPDMEFLIVIMPDSDAIIKNFLLISLDRFPPSKINYPPTALKSTYKKERFSSSSLIVSSDESVALIHPYIDSLQMPVKLPQSIFDVPPPNYRNSRSTKVGYESFVPITVAALLIMICTPFESQSGRGQKVFWRIVIFFQAYVMKTSYIFTPMNMGVLLPPIVTSVSQEVITAPYEEPIKVSPYIFIEQLFKFKIFEAVKVPELILTEVFDTVNRQFADENEGPEQNPLLILSQFPEKLIRP
ncbi:MAG: hypothetical protein EZS28_011063 [Streblomastix strix]|uniref:Uncharacterized protein n=1 Tax=Streblomastix strix TaxID=222440 RepID=A0A5J4WEW8_9EUKA|nr:MAG: hypothetical protein EZS28_011063 [Streblomastix strix]